MTEIVILFCTITCGILVGSYLQERLRAKITFCEDLSRYVSLLRVNVRSRQKCIKDFNAEFSLGCSKIFGEYICGVEKQNAVLSKQDRKTLSTFLKEINCMSADELNKQLEYYQKVFDELKINIEQQAKQKSGLYIKLGALIGAMIGILLL